MSSSENFEDILKQDVTPTAPPPQEDILRNLVNKINEFKAESDSYSNHVSQIIDDCLSFITDFPKPPQSWYDTVGDQAHRYEYHQIVLPDCYCDPLDTDEHNLDQLKRYSSDTHHALEYFLISRNHLLYSNHHYPKIYSPKPILLLESPMDDVIDWDCFLYIFADGSFICYNLEKEEEETIGLDVLEILEIYLNTLINLKMRFPEENQDFAYIGFPKEEC